MKWITLTHINGDDAKDCLFKAAARLFWPVERYAMCDTVGGKRDMVDDESIKIYHKMTAEWLCNEGIITTGELGRNYTIFLTRKKLNH